MTRQEALYKYTLRLGDDALVLSQRLSEWCSNAPFIEEDLALTNFALDMIGRAQVLLKYAADVEGLGKTEDILAFRRSERQYYNHLLAEQPNGDFAYTIVRQLYISAFEKLFFTELTKSKDETLAAVAAKTLKEVRYQLQHAEDWTTRLGNGTGESRWRMQQALNHLWMYTGELFEMDEVDALMLQEGIGVDNKALIRLWMEHISSCIEQANLDMPADGYMQTGSKKGIHTEHLGHLLCEMQFLQRAYPDAQW
jgi:ring-1,2-phenylacetyl-CoA epoxidase subunit PaaC